MRETIDGEMVNETERGRLVGYCSEDDGMADIGISIGLGDGRMIWMGETSTALYQHACYQTDGDDIGPNDGHWIVLFGPEDNDTVILGRLTDPYIARNALEGVLLTLLKETA